MKEWCHQVSFEATDRSMSWSRPHFQAAHWRISSVVRVNRPVIRWM